MNAERQGREPDDRATRELAERLSAHAVRYFPDIPGGQVSVRLLQRQSRPVTDLYRFRLQVGAEARTVLVKVPRSRGGSPQAGAEGPPPRRPRLSHPLPPHQRAAGEYRSMASIEAHLTALRDPRLGAVRVLDHLPEQNAFVMEQVNGPSLRRLLHAAHRGCRAEVAARPLEAFRNAGVWLRTYHDFVPSNDLEERRTCRASYCAFIAEVIEYLGVRTGQRRLFERVGASVAHAAEEVLPDSLPLGVGHGDFALRNVLVGASARVTVLDTLTRFRTPIYEDIGYFLVSLRHGWPQLSSLGAAFPAARLAGFEHAFLSGYFGTRAVPYGAVRLYELLAMLDLWAGTAERQPRGWREALECSVRLSLLKRGLGKRITRQADALRPLTADQSVPHPPRRSVDAAAVGSP